MRQRKTAAPPKTSVLTYAQYRSALKVDIIPVYFISNSLMNTDNAWNTGRFNPSWRFNRTSNGCRQFLRSYSGLASRSNIYDMYINEWWVPILIGLNLRGQIVTDPILKIEMKYVLLSWFFSSFFQKFSDFHFGVGCSKISEIIIKDNFSPLNFLTYYFQIYKNPVRNLNYLVKCFKNMIIE